MEKRCGMLFFFVVSFSRAGKCGNQFCRLPDLEQPMRRRSSGVTTRYLDNPWITSRESPLHTLSGVPVRPRHRSRR